MYSHLFFSCSAKFRVMKPVDDPTQLPLIPLTETLVSAYSMLAYAEVSKSQEMGGCTCRLSCAALHAGVLPTEILGEAGKGTSLVHVITKPLEKNSESVCIIKVKAPEKAVIGIGRVEPVRMNGFPEPSAESNTNKVSALLCSEN